MVGWEVYRGVKWEDEEDTGQIVYECRQLSTKPVVKRQTGQKSTRTRLSRKWRNPKINQDEKFSEI